MSKHTHNRFVMYSDSNEVTLIFKLEFDQDAEPTHVQIMDRIYQEVVEDILAKPVTLDYAKAYMINNKMAVDTYYEFASHTIFDIFEVVIRAQQSEPYDSLRAMELCCELNRGDIALSRRVEEYATWIDSERMGVTQKSLEILGRCGVNNFSIIWFNCDNIYLNFNTSGTIATNSVSGRNMSMTIRETFSDSIVLGKPTSPNTLSQMKIESRLTLAATRKLNLPVTELEQD